jgi:hypothetical protein
MHPAKTIKAEIKGAKDSSPENGIPIGGII